MVGLNRVPIRAAANRVGAGPGGPSAFTEHTTPVRIANLFGLADLPDTRSRYDVAPSQLVPVAGAEADGRRGLSAFRWGFVPHWANDPKGCHRPEKPRPRQWPRPRSSGTPSPASAV